MATKRIHVPVSDETRQILDLCSEATGRSVASLCAELLEQTAPVMAEMASALLMARTAPARAMRHMVEVMDSKVAELDQFKLDLSPKDTGKQKKAG